MTKRLLFVLLLIGLLMTAGCGESSGVQEPTKGEVWVFVAVPLSGFQANGGQTVLGGVRLAAEQLNRSGGLNGYKVVVVPLDDESDDEVAVAQVAQIQEALNQGKRVVAVIGHLNSGQTLAAMELYHTLPLLVITPTASEQSLTARGYTNFFRVNASDDVQAAVDARFLTEKLGAKRVAVLFNNTEYGRGLAAALVKELEARGAQAVTRIEVEEGQGRYSAEVAQVQSAAPDAIFYAGYEIETPYLRAELVRAGVTAPMLASDGAFLAATIDESDGTAEGMYVSAFAPSPRAVGDPQWFEAYQAVEYRNPDTYSVNGYVAMQVLAEGVRQAGSLEASEIAAALRRAPVKTLLNELRYKENGDLTDPQIWIYQVKDGEFQQVEW
ncbi:MAG: branched-chain amino acid ABC transporter substrate-binding protein [Chloroflexi bacterium]|nr:branched-chain amino acid ABC transporter substrate-binding protein [Chloroflexota bacterium]HQJ10982.1 branched-chain amino acid ABC transporter substrate-binding protein [Anaerolineae bacterium]